MENNIYQIQNIAHYYEDHPALQIQHLCIQRESIIGLIGPNGSGKSTLLKILAFVETPSKGKIFFNGQQRQLFSDAVRFRVSLLMQEPYLLKRSVFDNVAYGMKIRGEKKNCKERIQNALAMVGLPADFATRRWNALSGGEAQRVALAARLVLKPEVLLLDEPTANVDAASAEMIRDASLNARSTWGATLIIASHDRQWLYDVCDEVIYLFKGQILSRCMENTVFGPWNKVTNSKFKKILHRGQQFIVPPPPYPDAVAFIDPGNISPTTSPPKEELENTLTGIVSRLSLEKSTGNIMASLMIDHLSLTFRINSEQISAMNIHPGKNISVCYNIQDVKWQ